MLKRILSFVMAAVLCLQLLPAGVLAAEPDTGLCGHHTAHDAACGYAQGSPAAACTHGAHTDDCYKTVCSRHVCGEGCVQYGPCSFRCTGAEDCLTTAPVCGHKEDGSCCAQAEVPAQACGYVCSLCKSDALPVLTALTPEKQGQVPAAVSAIGCYVVAGETGLCGSSWDSKDINNLMTENSDGTYSKVFTDVAPGKYAFKVCLNEAEDTRHWYGDAGGNNIQIKVSKTTDLTISFDPVAVEVTFSGEGVSLNTSLDIDLMTAVGNGSGSWLNGAEWDPAAWSNRMTEISDGVYRIQYTGVTKSSEYQIKFAANGSWADNWGVDDFYYEHPVESGKTYDAVYGGSNIYVSVPYDKAAVTLTMDLSGYNAADKSGAAFTVLVEEELHQWSEEWTSDGEGHWKGCSHCSEKNDYAAHTPAADDSDCTTAVTCTVCGHVVTDAKQHSFTDAADTSCDNEGCGYTRTAHSHDKVDFISWTATDSLPAEEGNYCLEADVILDSAWKPAGSTILCLNGHSITQQTWVPCIIVNSGVTLDLYDCGTSGKLTHTEGNRGRGAEIVGGTLTLHSGSICGNTGSTADTSGGGVYIESGSFTMKGGSIAGNAAAASKTGYGGGVSVKSSAVFTMEGGSISGNDALSSGGGVYNEGTFKMTGGSITGNTSVIGGGVSNGGSFIMTGGSITGNAATEAIGGVAQLGAMTVSGSAKITGNAVKAEGAAAGTASNVGLISAASYLTVGGLGTGASIGISCLDTSFAPTSGTISDAPASAYASYFTSDDRGYAVTADGDGNLVLTKAHAHDGITYDTSWQGAVDQATIDENTSIVLAEDATVSDCLRINSGVTVHICLNGKKLDMGEFNIANKGTLQICDCQSGGSITSTAMYCIYNNGGTLTVLGGNITGESYAARNNEGAMTVSGGSFSGGQYGVFNRSTILTVSGGSFSGSEYGIYNNGTLYLSGSPTIQGNDASHSDIYAYSASKIYATATDDASSAAYTGSPVTVSTSMVKDGDVIIHNAKAEDGAFTLTAKPGYALAQGTGENANHLVLTKAQLASVSVKVSWLDNADQDGLRPQSLTVALVKDGVDTDVTMTANPATNWECLFEGLDKYENGMQITYSVRVVAMPTGYTSSVRGDMASGYSITCIHTPETVKAEGTITWKDADNQDGKRPESVTVQLLKDGKSIAARTVTEAEGWSYSFGSLPKYENGKEIGYGIAVEAVDQYDAAVSGWNVTLSCHIHVWAAEWSSDKDSHWYACTAEGCDGTKGSFAAHIFDAEGVCGTCGWECPHESVSEAGVCGGCGKKYALSLTDVSVRQAGSLTYTGSLQRAQVQTSAAAVGGRAVTFTYSTDPEGDYTTDVPAFTDAGEYTVYFKAEADNHEPASGSFTVTIEKAVPDPGAVTLDSSDAVYPGYKPEDIGLSREQEDVAGTLALDARQTLTVGTREYSWTFTPADTANYSTVTGKISITVIQDSLVSLTIKGVPDKTAYSYGETADLTGVTVTAVYASGLTADVTDSLTIPALAVGQTSVTLSYTEKGVTKTCELSGLTVGKKQLDVSGIAWDISASPFTYDGTAKSVSLTGLLPELTAEQSGHTATEPGSYTASATLKLAEGYSTDNYEIQGNAAVTAGWVIGKAPQAALSVGTISNKVYGSAPFTLTASGGSTTAEVTFESSDESILSISGSTATIHKPGTVTITARKAGDAHYLDVSGSRTITVGKATVTVKADNKKMALKGSKPELTYTVTGLVGGDTFTKPKLETPDLNTGACGSYDITVSGGTLSNEDHYNPIVYEKGTLKVVWWEYKITKGADQSVRKGNTASFTSSAAYRLFDEVHVDGKRISSANYTVKSGSTVVTLKASYIRTLSLGKHTLTIVSDNGEASTTFTVKAASDSDTPRTGDITRSGLWLSLALVGLAGLLVSIAAKKRFAKRR